jgi:hypothetical protein
LAIPDGYLFSKSQLTEREWRKGAVRKITCKSKKKKNSKPKEEKGDDSTNE